MNYERIYDGLVQRALDRVPEGYVERHHILPKCMGGSDDKSNMVALYPEEHFVAHVLLLKIHKNSEHRHSLAKAVNMMLQESKGRKHSRLKGRKLYGQLKREHSLAMSISQSGEGNSHFGTKQFSNEEFKETCRFVPGEQPDGQVEGRQTQKKKERKNKRYDCVCSICFNYFQGRWKNSDTCSVKCSSEKGARKNRSVKDFLISSNFIEVQERNRRKKSPALKELGLVNAGGYSKISEELIIEYLQS